MRIMFNFISGAVLLGYLGGCQFTGKPPQASFYHAVYDHFREHMLIPAPPLNVDTFLMRPNNFDTLVIEKQRVLEPQMVLKGCTVLKKREVHADMFSFADETVLFCDQDCGQLMENQAPRYKTCKLIFYSLQACGTDRLTLFIWASVGGAAELHRLDMSFAQGQWKVDHFERIGTS